MVGATGPTSCGASSDVSTGHQPRIKRGWWPFWFTRMTVKTKPGVYFASTPSGGTLMDIEADAFIALTPMSAAIWRAITSEDGVSGAAAALTITWQLSAAKASHIVSRQIDRWRAERLVDSAASTSLPEARAASNALSRSLLASDVNGEWPSPSAAWGILAEQRRFRQLIQTTGLGATLRHLPRVAKASGATQRCLRVVRAYQFVRRAFHQSRTSRDCLVRSMALTSLLRRNGVDAELCIGIQDLPFTAHAWVEWGGCALNESLQECRRYVVIGRF